MTANNTADALSIFDPDGGVIDIVETAAGMRAQFIADGWTRDQAQDIVAAMFRQLGHPETPS